MCVGGRAGQCGCGASAWVCGCPGARANGCAVVWVFFLTLFFQKKMCSYVPIINNTRNTTIFTCHC